MWLLKRKKAKQTEQDKPGPAVEQPRVSRKAETVKVLQVLDAPELSIEEKESEAGFDPYDTGVFDRSKIWESWQNQD